MSKNTGKKGSLAALSIDYKQEVTLDDLMYAYTGKKAIDSLYEKLRLIYDRSLRKKPANYRDFIKKHKISTRLMPEMKRLGYCNESSNWQLNHPPRKGDAVILQLAIRKSEQKAKKRVEERKLEHIKKYGAS